MDGEMRLSPPWKHALSVLVERGLEYGQVLRHDDLRELFGLAEPVTAADQRSFQLEFTKQLTALHAELLETHRLTLRTMRGERAYQVVAPHEQTDLAMREGMRDMRQAVSKMVRRVTYIRHEELTDEQQRKNNDAQGKAAFFAGMIRNPKLPAPKQ